MINKDLTLENARNYESENINIINKNEKPGFHLCAPIGWINDPNGFSMFNGEYHLFYQYHPYGTDWGPMHWGHSKSKDLLKWDQLPVALAPDREYDCSGCFSGSAVEYNGKHVIMYTGVLEETEEYGKRHVRQTQCIAIGDGVNYKKLECNPVITHELLPEGSNVEDFRDPKIWREGDAFYSVIASRADDNSGQIVMYKSSDLKSWELVSVLDKSRNEIGEMWECPDFFSIDGKDILIISPMEVKANSKGYVNGHNAIFLTGNYNKETYCFERETDELIDGGLDFYAPQTLETEDGRRIMIAWMQNWENKIVPNDFKWSGMMTIPRELSVEDGKIIQRPIREIESYHEDTIEYKDIRIEDEVELEGISGRTIDLLIDINCVNSKEFIIKLAKNQEFETLVSYNPVHNVISFDRSFSGRLRNTVHKREIKVKKQGDKIKLRILLDKYSAEIFINDGEQTMTSTFYTPLEANKVTFTSIGESIVNIKKHDIVI